MATAPLPPSNAEISAVAPQTPPLSQVERIVNTFVAPSKTFADIRRSRAWWAPFLLMLIISWLFVYVAGQKVGFRKITENQMQAQPKQQARMEGMPAADRERALEIGSKFTVGIGIAFPAFQLLIVLIIGALMFAIFKMFAGADITFGATYAVLMYAGLPGVIKIILAIISLLAGASPDSFTMQNPLGSNIGYYLNPADSPFLYSLCSQLDVFLIWTLVLSAIGFTCVSKIKRSTSFIAVFGLWLVLTAMLSSLALLA
jgi:hypothetical protein